MELMTAAIAEQLYQNDQHTAETGEDSETVVVKYFDPQGAATWYVTSGQPMKDGDLTDDINDADDWRLYGFATMGDDRCAEFGYSLLSDLQSYRGPFQLGIERDLGFGEHSVKECARRIKERSPHRPQL